MKKLGLLIDLSFTDKYYDSQELADSGDLPAYMILIIFVWILAPLVNWVSLSLM